MPGPLGRRSWLVSLIAPVLVGLGLLALDAWPLTLLPFVGWLKGGIRATTQALALAALGDGLILILVLALAWVRRRSGNRQRAVVSGPMATHNPQLGAGETLPMEQPRPSVFKKMP